MRLRNRAFNQRSKQRIGPQSRDEKVLQAVELIQDFHGPSLRLTFDSMRVCLGGRFRALRAPARTLKMSRHLAEELGNRAEAELARVCIQAASDQAYGCLIPTQNLGQRCRLEWRLHLLDRLGDLAIETSPLQLEGQELRNIGSVTSAQDEPLLTSGLELEQLCQFSAGDAILREPAVRVGFRLEPPATAKVFEQPC